MECFHGNELKLMEMSAKNRLIISFPGKLYFAVNELIVLVIFVGHKYNFSFHYNYSLSYGFYYII